MIALKRDGQGLQIQRLQKEMLDMRDEYLAYEKEEIDTSRETDRERDLRKGKWQLFKEKYLFEVKGFKGQAERIAKTAAKHTVLENAEQKFFDLIFLFLLDEPLLPRQFHKMG